MSRIALSLLALSAFALPARAQSLAGTWKISFPAGMRIIDGNPEVIMGTGSLAIEERQDSVIGQLMTAPSPDRPARPPARLAGTMTAGEATLVSRTQATINMNGAQEQAVAVTTWVLHARGDSLTGTLARTIEGHDMANQSPSPVSGTRKR